VKLLKALNYKKYKLGFSKFKRRKFSRWKRRQNWLIYNQVIKNWVIDYKFNKNLAKSQYFENMFLNNFFVYNFEYIKKKNPLTWTNANDYYLYSCSKLFFFYFFQRLKKKNILNTTTLFKNSNFLIVSKCETDLKNFNKLSNMIDVFNKSENLSYFVDDKINVTSQKPNLFSLNIFLTKTVTLHLINFYKIFIFFFYYKI
jgi:hypothetical protein